MHYYIDGYNLLFYLFGKNEGSFTERRDWLIHKLNAKASALSIDMTLVFDSQHCEGTGTRSHYHHLEILYTPQNMTADDCIVQILQEARHPDKMILITNDRGLSYRVKDLSVHTQSIDQFINWLDRRYKNKRNKQEQHTAAFKLPPSRLSPPPAKEPPKQQIDDSSTKTANFITTPGSIEYYLQQFTLADEKFLSERAAAKLKRKQAKKKSC